MARPAQVTRETLTPLLRARGPVSATELAAALRVNRTTVARTLPDFGDELVTLGATRSTRYLLRRQVRNAGNRWPVYRMDETGRAGEWAELEALHDRAWRIVWAGEPPTWAGHFTDSHGLWIGFPFFLGDARPQGFLGRAIARQISVPFQLPEDPRSWGDEDIVVFLQAAGEDLPGNLVVGDDCLRRALARSAVLPTGHAMDEADRGALYPTRAIEIAQGLPGSSAGGEQPKFLTTLRTEGGDFRPVLVKFSGPMDQPAGQRWADLLRCEFHAHEVLAAAGLTHPGARVLDAGGRRFLEVPRFDREGAGGRSGVVSLEALHAAAIGSRVGRWPDAAVELRNRSLIGDDTVATIRRLHAFGELIGNTDMHFGNLAFRLDDTMPFRVTPAYDMLPMLWAPGTQGELIHRPHTPAPPLPAGLEAWRESAVWADDFWQRVETDDAISNNLRNEAQNCHAVTRALRAHVG